MSELPQIHGFSGGTSRSSQEKVSASNEEMSIIDYAEPARWTFTSNATESSELCDIFRVLSDIQLQEPALALIADTKDEILTARNNQRALEHGEPSTSTGKRKAEELALDKLSSKGNEQLLNESKKKETKAKKPRSLVLHSMSERRRRGRINEKIKSLHQLIPNSDKRDCASILDEAIKYLKMLKDQAAQIQMMSMGMTSVYYNPYMSATGIPHIPVAQYYPLAYAPFRPGMRLVPSVPMRFPTVGNPSGILPLVQDPMELGPSLPIPGTNSLPALQPKSTAVPTSHFEDHSKERSPFKELEKGVCGSKEASTSGQMVPKTSPGYIVHATHIVPPATTEKNNL